MSGRDIAPEVAAGADGDVFDPFSAMYVEDKPAVQQDLRERCPFHHYEGDGLDFWTLSRHSDVTEVLREPVLWSTQHGPGAIKRTPDLARAGLLGVDPPLHVTRRRLVNKAFTPRVVAEMESSIQQIADELVDGFAAQGDVELVHEFAVPLPVIVIARMLGVPTSDLRQFRHWSDVIVAALSGAPGTADANDEARAAFDRYFLGFIEEREALLRAGRPLPDDLVSGLVVAEQDGERLSHDEMLGILIQLLVAGNETTTSLIGNLVFRLLERPDQLALVLERPQLIDNAIEESLRFDAPVQGLFRTNQEAVRVHGIDLAPDTKVMILYGSANRDPEAWERPDEFLVDRDLQHLRTHYAFGFGTHYCLGAPLARLEGKVALRTLFGRLPGLRLAGEPTRVTPMLFSGFSQLPVAWDV